MSEAQQPPSGVDRQDTRKRVFAIVASASGNLVEWYDFYIYALHQFILPTSFTLPETIRLQLF